MVQEGVGKDFPLRPSRWISLNLALARLVGTLLVATAVSRALEPTVKIRPRGISTGSTSSEAFAVPPNLAAHRQAYNRTIRGRRATPGNRAPQVRACKITGELHITTVRSRPLLG